MADAEVATRRVRLVTIAVILGVFVAGALAGAGLYRAFTPRRMPPPRPPLFLPLHELSLTPEQDVKVRAIMESHREELDVILRESFPRVRAVNEKIEAEVRVVLTPAQQKTLEELKARRPPPPPHGHGPPGGPGGPGGPPPGMPGFLPPPPPPDNAPPR